MYDYWQLSAVKRAVKPVARRMQSRHVAKTCFSDVLKIDPKIAGADTFMLS